MSRGQPRLITSLRNVPPGTNGGVSLLGTAAGILGGAVMGGAAAAASAVSAARAVLPSALSHLHALGSHRATRSAWALMMRHSHVASLVRRAGVREPSLVPAMPGELSGPAFGVAMVALGALLGLLGTLLDSLLGAQLQFSGWDNERKRVVSTPGVHVKHLSGCVVLSNDGVNAVSILLVTSLAGAVMWFM